MQAGVCLPPAPETLPVSCLVPTSLPPLRWLTSAQEQGWLRTGKSFLLISFEQLRVCSGFGKSHGFSSALGREHSLGHCWADSGSLPVLPWGAPSSLSCASWPLHGRDFSKGYSYVFCFFFLCWMKEQRGDCWLGTHYMLYLIQLY